MWVTSSPTTALTPTAIALGNFDGIHLGHRQVIEPVLPSSVFPSSVFPASALPASALPSSVFPASALLSSPQTGQDAASESEQAGISPEHLYPTLVTFDPHPQEFFSGQPRCLLTPLAEKVELLRAIGLAQLVLLPFDRELASLRPEQFVEDILVRQLRAKQISIGVDFCFGRQRAGTATDLQQIAAAHGVEVAIAPLKEQAGKRISSSAIRQALQEGDLQTANRLLGRPYYIVGKVFQGQQLGRTLGFPTANLQLPPEKFLPRQGVYVVRVHICEASDKLNLTSPPALLGVMNIGLRPTVDGSNQVVEVHLLDWAGDLYGQTLVVSLQHFLRPEQKFASLANLKTQIEADCLIARNLFSRPAATDMAE